MISLLTGPNWEAGRERLDQLRTELHGMGAALGGAPQSGINGAEPRTPSFHPFLKSQRPGPKRSFIAELGKAWIHVPETRIRCP